MRFTVLTSLGEIRVADGSFETDAAGVLTVRSDGQTTVLSPHFWFKVTHADG